MLNKVKIMRNLVLGLAVLFSIVACGEKEDVSPMKVGGNTMTKCIMTGWMNSEVSYDKNGEVDSVTSENQIMVFHRENGVLKSYTLLMGEININYKVVLNGSGFIETMFNDIDTINFYYSSDKLIKYSYKNEFTELEYIGGNVSKIKTTSNNDGVITVKEQTCTYDSKPNPFKVFKNTPYFSPIAQSDNNIIKIVEGGKTNNSEYTYNENGFPTSVKSNDGDLEYKINYDCNL
jgi:hypothetical protein